MLFCQQHIAEPLPRDFHKQFFNLFQIFQQLVRKRETATRVSYALLFNAGSGLSSFTPSASEPAGCSTLRPSSRPPAPPCAAKHEAARSSPALQLPPRLPPRVPSPRARSRSALTADGGGGGRGSRSPPRARRPCRERCCAALRLPSGGSAAPLEPSGLPPRGNGVAASSSSSGSPPPPSAGRAEREGHGGR